MNPVLVQILNSAVRSFVIFILGGLVARGIIEKTDADAAVSVLVNILVPAILALSVAVYGVLRARFQQKMLVTSQAMPQGSTTKEVIAVVKSGLAPDSNLPRDIAPSPISRATVEKALEEAE